MSFAEVLGLNLFRYITVSMIYVLYTFISRVPFREWTALDDARCARFRNLLKKKKVHQNLLIIKQVHINLLIINISLENLLIINISLENLLIINISNRFLLNLFLEVLVGPACRHYCTLANNKTVFVYHPYNGQLYID